MSLVRLLTAGKSLVGLKDSTSRYQMRARHLLPKFGADKNPFAPFTTPEPVDAIAVPEPAVPAPEPIAPEMSPDEIAAAQLKETKRLPVAAAVPALAPTPPAAARPSKIMPKIGVVLDWIERWSGKLRPGNWRVSNPLPATAKTKPKAKPFAAHPATGKTPVQGELSLENIKVVRNDLNDSDLEIVPSNTAAKARARAIVSAGQLAEELAETT